MSQYEQFGHKRRVVGAGYGTMSFLIQRITAIILAVYAIVFLLAVLFQPINFETWRGLFTFTCMGLPLGKLFASLAFLALVYHAWIGVRDIWMDYITIVSLRLALQALTILWLVGSVVYFASVLWSL